MGRTRPTMVGHSNQFCPVLACTGLSNQYKPAQVSVPNQTGQPPQVVILFKQTPHLLMRSLFKRVMETSR